MRYDEKRDKKQGKGRYESKIGTMDTGSAADKTVKAVIKQEQWEKFDETANQ